MKNILRLQLRLPNTNRRESSQRPPPILFINAIRICVRVGIKKNIETKQHKGTSSVTQHEMLQLFRINSFLFTFELAKILLVLTFIFISKTTIHTFIP